VSPIRPDQHCDQQVSPTSITTTKVTNDAIEAAHIARLRNRGDAFDSRADSALAAIGVIRQS
jgi:hypothetical protein